MEEISEQKPASPTKSILKNSPLRNSPRISEMAPNLISLNTDQCKNLPFPISTLVWWESAENGLNEGKVNAVYFDTKSRGLLYDVASRHHSEPVLLSSEVLSYAPSSSVFISPNLHKRGNESAHDLLTKGAILLKGNVLLAKKLDNGHSNGHKVWVYTVSIEYGDGIQMVENIPSCNITFRS